MSSDAASVCRVRGRRRRRRSETRRTLDEREDPVLEQPALGTARFDTLKAELTRLEGELSRYAEAIADAGPLATILEAVKVRDRKPRFIYEFKGETSLSGLIAGLISASSVVAPTGHDRTCIIQVRDFIAR